MASSSFLTMYNLLLSGFHRLFILSFLVVLASCAQNPDKALKRSANGRLLDVNGFDGGKRRPVYNKKYIAKAKKNVVEKEFDNDDLDDEFDEIYNPSVYHRQMYEKMVKRDRDAQGKVRKKKRRYAQQLSKSQPMDLREADMRLKDIPRRDISAIEQEMQAMRQLLEETKSELLQQQEIARKAKEDAAAAIEIAKQEIAQSEVVVQNEASSAQSQAELNKQAAIREQRYQEESLKILEKKRETLKEQLLSDQALLSATSDKDLASEVIKVIDNGGSGQDQALTQPLQK